MNEIKTYLRCWNRYAVTTVVIGMIVKPTILLLTKDLAYTTLLCNEDEKSVQPFTILQEKINKWQSCPQKIKRNKKITKLNKINNYNK